MVKTYKVAKLNLLELQILPMAPNRLKIALFLRLAKLIFFLIWDMRCFWQIVASSGATIPRVIPGLSKGF
jgi:hypothetical protein